MEVSARLASRRILPGVQQQNLAVAITAPNLLTRTVRGRPPLSLAIVIDRSGSMHGPPIANAKAAALSMLRQLEARDAFTVVTYSSRAETVVAIESATEANKAAARAAIETIDDDGGTCISCGLDAAASELARSPVVGGLRRLLLISDGQATQGIHERGELADLAAHTAATGVSISTVGVGLDFDEATMRRLAEVGRGHYYFVEDTVALSTMFVRELATLSETVASDVQLRILELPGVRVEEVYGYPMTRGPDGVVVPIADLRAGESRKVVLRLSVSAPRTGELAIARAVVDWRRVSDGALRTAHALARVDVVDDPAAVAGSFDLAAVQAIEQALSGRALDEAAAAYDRGGLPAARAVLEHRAHEMRAAAPHLDPATVQALGEAARETLDGLERAPEQAKKAASITAHELSR
jgi:Ca-activated chloride channel family protein